MLIARPKVFGLTGNFGCGKTTVAKMLRAYSDVIVLYTDPLAKWLLNQEKGRKKLSELFGDRVFDGGRVDFRKLAQLIFSDLELKRKLENFIHAWVKKEIDRQVWQIDHEKIVVVESALIFEANWQSYFDGVVAVVCDERVQRRRILARGKVSLAEIRERLARQFSQEEKVRRAQFVIDTDCGLEELRNKVAELYQDLKNRGFCR